MRRTAASSGMCLIVILLRLPILSALPCQGFPGLTSWQYSTLANGPSLAFSPDGSRVALGSGGSNVASVRDVTGSSLLNFTGHTQALSCVAWSDDGLFLATGSYDDSVKIWDATSGLCLRTLIRPQMNAVSDIALSSDGRLASSYIDAINIWDVASGALLRNLTVTSTTSLAWSGLLASGSYDTSIKIWNPTSGSCLHTLTGHTGPVWSVAWSEDNIRLASSSDDLTIKIWDTTSALCLKTMTGHTRTVYSVVWTGLRLASSSLDASIKIWDVISGSYLQTWTQCGDLSPLAWNSKSLRLASMCYDTVKIWDLTPGSYLQTFDHGSAVASVAWSNDGLLAISGGNNFTEIWDGTSGSLLRTLPHTNNVIAWSDRRLASGATDGLVKIWNATSGSLLQTLTGHNGSVWAVAWRSDGLRLASCGLDTLIKIWDVASGLCLRNLPGGVPFTLAWSSDGRLASASFVTISIWNATSGSLLFNLTGHTGTIWGVAWSSDGLRLASASQDGTIKIWNVPSRVCSNTLTGHTGAVQSVAWSGDGLNLASGSQDLSLKIWNATSGLCLRTLTGHSAAIRSVAWRGDRLASGSQDSTARIWYAHWFSFQMQGSATPTFTATGSLLEGSGLVQLFRAGNEQFWLDCIQVELSGSNTSVTATVVESLAPGLYGVAYRDRYDDIPWTNFTPFTVPCPKGTEVRFNREPNAACVPCPNGTYSSSASLTPCVPCIGNLNLDSTNCTACLDRAYFDGRKCACYVSFYPVTSTTCGDCPVHGVCDGTSVVAETGYWQTPDDRTQFLRCANQEACEGGTCQAGYHGVLCGECVPGYGQYQRLCEPCPNKDSNALILLFSIVASLGLFVLFVYKSWHHRPGKTQLVLSTIKIALSAAQVNALLYGLGVRLTAAVEALIDIQVSVQSGGSTMLSLSCAFLDSGMSTDSVFFANCLIWLLTVPILCLVCFVISKLFALGGREINLRRLLITSLCCFMFTFHTTITLQTFQIFVCRPVDSSSTYRLSADLAVICYSPRHFTYIFLVGVPLLVFYVIAPPLIASRYLRNLKQEQPNEIAFLCSEFDPKFRWWFLIVLLRKVIIALFSALSVLAPEVQGLAIIVVLLAFALVNRRVSPYASSLQPLNLAEILSLCSSGCLFLIVSILFLNRSSESAQEGGGVIMALIVIAFYSFLVGLVLKHSIPRSYQQRACPCMVDKTKDQDQLALTPLE